MGRQEGKGGEELEEGKERPLVYPLKEMREVNVRHHQRESLHEKEELLS